MGRAWRGQPPGKEVEVGPVGGAAQGAALFPGGRGGFGAGWALCDDSGHSGLKQEATGPVREAVR